MLLADKQSNVEKEAAGGNFAEDVSTFKNLVSQGIIDGLSPVESDTLIANVVSSICDFSAGGDAVDAPFDFVASAMTFALAFIRRRERR